MLEWLFGKKLSPAEIDRTIEKIRQEYDHYIVHFQKPPTAKHQFEERLRRARLTLMDMTFFLGEELKILQRLLREAEEEAQRRQNEPPKPPSQPGKAKSYADRVLEKLQKAIEPYPSRHLHPEANIDVDRLYGTLEWLARDIWPLLVPHLRELDPRTLQRREEELSRLIPGPGKLSKEEEVYRALLEARAPLHRIALQQKELILQAAFWIHRSRALLCRGAQVTDPRVREGFEKALAFWDKIILDFRLRDLKPPAEEKG